MPNSAVRTLFKSISDKTFEECFSDIYWPDEAVKKRLKEQLIDLNILKLKVNGYCVEKLH
jgi:hypothetical protein